MKYTIVVAFLFAFVFSSVLSTWHLWNKKQSHIENFLANKSKQVKLNYNSLYHEHQKIADIIFKTQINTTHVKSIVAQAMQSSHINNTRAKLFEKLQPVYEILQKYSLQQLHFHLPSNESFLRFHRPSKFGDDLTVARKTVAYSNSKQTKISGFEEGKIFNGYRFVYPLFFKENHIGSVEISFSTLAFNHEYMQDYTDTMICLIKKERVNKTVFQSERINYKESFLQDYFIQRAEQSNYKKFRLTHTQKKQIQQKKVLSVHNQKIKSVLTFIPLINPVSKQVSAFHIVYSSDKFIQNKIRDFYIMSFGLSVLWGVLFFYIFKNYQKKCKLSQLNNSLENKIKKALDDLKRKDAMLTKLAKSAAMGEMIEAIAHQLKTPLSILKMYLENLSYDIEQTNINKALVRNDLEVMHKQLQHSTQTIDSFKDFFEPNSSLASMYLKQVVEQTLALVKDELIKHTINVTVDIDEAMQIYLLENEFKHILLNLISNSKDAFIFNNTHNRKITITAKKVKFETKIFFEDSAGGIPTHHIHKIFEPKFTTKHNLGGSGIGLYMSQQILHKIGANITAYNQNNGACFEITLLEASPIRPQTNSFS